MKRSDIEFIKDIIESINIIEDYLNEYSENDFRKDKKIQKLFIYEVMMIGEAASKVSIQTQAKYNTINWRIIRDMRNFLIHEYYKVSIDIIWSTVNRDIPILKKQMQTINIDN